jgi:DNA-binding NarL/FixJ family response regulator
MPALDPPLSLDGITIVIVEDDYTVAEGLKFLVEAYDGAVAGMAATVESAIRLVSEKTFDVAILDIDLRGKSVSPVADHLSRNARRFVFLSGYGDAEMLPPALRSIPRLDKPVDPQLLVTTIRGVSGRHATA